MRQKWDRPFGMVARMLRTVLLALGLLFAAAAPAGAATLRMSSWSDGPFGAGNLSGGSIWPVYTAAPGEANALTVSNTGSSLVVSDPGAIITTSWHYQPCTVSSDQHTATCPIQGASGGLAVDLGDGDDHAQVHPYATPYPIRVSNVEGGAGDDVIEADTGPLSGGAGDDTLTITGGGGTTMSGGPGADHLVGGPGNDLVAGGPGDDLVDGADGADSLYDGTPENPTDDGRDELVGGPGNDQLYARGGVDTLRAGDGSDTIFAADAVTAAGSSTASTPDAVDCGAGDDGGLLDGVDAATGCETVHLGCDGLRTSPWIVPVGPCSRPAVADLPTPGAATTTTTPAPAAPGSTPAPTPATGPTTPRPAAPKAPAAPLTARLRLSITRARPPLTVIPRALITLSATANVTITYGRVSGPGLVALPGTITRRIAGGDEKNISLVVLLGGRQRFVAGRYRVTLTATTSDGRTAKASALIRMLREQPKRRAPAKRHR
jgi:hypothetical protein